MRLDKLLEYHKCGSRGQVKKLLSGQHVTVDGVVVTNGSQIVDSGLQEIKVGERHLADFSEKYFIVNKPAGVVTACRDNQHQTVISLIDEEDRDENLYPVGRLDRDTEGLVLVTTNGPLGYRMLHPKHHVDKVYYVEVNGFLSDDAIAFFTSGVTFLDGTVCRSATLTLLDCSAHKSTAYLRLSEGKFHQVKKMFLAYGVKVTYLKRISFGDFQLGDLGLGEYRSLTSVEKISILSYFEK